MATINSKKTQFVGFDTTNTLKAPFVLTNIELIKQDIKNHFNTLVGSRVMLPDFGSNIPNYLFDPFDDITKTLIIEDATRVVTSDPRVDLQNIEVTYGDQSITLNITLTFKPDYVTDSLYVTFTNNNTAI